MSYGWRYTCGTAEPDSGATYSYDAVGNRTDHSAIITAGNRLARFNGDTITYDDDGNMIRRYNPTSGADRRYAWNALGQLDSTTVVSAINPETGLRTTTVERYRYDASGRLVHMDHGQLVNGVFVYSDSSQHWAVYQGGQVSELVQSPIYYTDVAYDDGTDRPALEYVHVVPSDSWHAEVMDALGNVAGSVAQDTIGVPYTWDAWGANTSATWDNTEVLGWKGLQSATQTGLVYMRARWYDPALGRFLSEDPVGLAGGLNQYAFAGDDPINTGDPTGMFVDDDYLCVKFSNGRVVCNGSLLVVNVTAKADPNPFSSPFNWIDPSEPADVPSIQALSLVPGGGTMTQRQHPTTKPDPYPKRLFGTHWCGPGGAGPAVSALDSACQRHDVCYDESHLSAGSNFNPFPGGHELTALSICNKRLCIAVAGSASSSPVASTLVYLYFRFVPVRATCY